MAFIKDLIVRIKGDSTGLEKTTKKAQGDISAMGAKTKGIASKIVTAFKGIGAAIGAAFAVKSVVKFASESVKLYDVQAKAAQKVATAVKQTGMAAGFTAKELEGFASGLQSITTLGDEQILNDVTAQLLTFTNIAGEQFKRTQIAAMNVATVLDGDMKSASIQLGKALNDPVKNLSALSRAGIQFSKEQQTTINRLVETNQLAKAQTIILDELDKQYGGQAEAMAKVGLGPWKQITNTIGDMREELGKHLMPMINKVGIFVAGLLPKIQTGLAKLRQGAVGLANNIIDLYNESAAFRAIIAAVELAGKNAFAGIKLAVQQVVTSVATLGKVVGAALRGKFKEIPGIIRDGFSKAIDNTKSFGVKIAENIKDGINTIKKKHIEPIKIKPADEAEVIGGFKSAGKKAGEAFAEGVDDGANSMEPLRTLGGPRTINQKIERTVEKPRMVEGAEILPSTIPDIASQVEEQTAKINPLLDSMTNAAMEFGNAIMQAGVEGEDGLKGLARVAVSTAKKIISAELAKGVASAVSSALSSVPFPFNIVAGGVAGGAAAALFNNLIPSFAGGGIATKPMLAMVGDNPGRKEAIIPSEMWDRIGGVGRLYTEVSGRNLRIILDRENKFLDRT